MSNFLSTIIPGFINTTLGAFKIVGAEDGALVTRDIFHEKVEAGLAYFLSYSVADLGAATTPNDMMTLTFTTSADLDQVAHFEFAAKGTSGWQVRMIEAPTGGAASATGKRPCLNFNRNSSNTSSLIALDGVAGFVSYDATLGTGGLTLIDEYIEGAATGAFRSSSSTNSRQEIPLKVSTKYQISLFGVDNDAGTLNMFWYHSAT